MSNELRDDILAFARQMENKMGKHDDDRGDLWKICELKVLRDCLRDEINEWKAADSPGKEADELIDIANFAMMLFSRIKLQE